MAMKCAKENANGCRDQWMNDCMGATAGSDPGFGYLRMGADRQASHHLS
jgi:hypothetical protein